MSTPQGNRCEKLLQSQLCCHTSAEHLEKITFKILLKYKTDPSRRELAIRPAKRQTISGINREPSFKEAT
jgi:hypothetical protein